MQIAVVQFNPAFASPKRNAERICSFLESAAVDGAKLVVFPEGAVTGYCFRSQEEARAAAVSISSAEVCGIAEVCAARGMHAIVGLAERDADKLFNSAVFLGPDGIVGVYRKTHIPCLGLDRFVQPGDSLPVYDTRIGRIGILICFDIRFPEAVRTMALRGAELVCLPTNWPESAEGASDLVCPTRAIENHIFVAASNRVGEENGFRFIGRSKVIAPGGAVLAAADHEKETVIFADLDLSAARNKHIVRKPGEYEMDLFASRRPELYDEGGGHNATL